MSAISQHLQRELEILGRGSHAYPPKPMGEVFWVDHFAGDNDHYGQNKDRPLQTITEALTRCVNDRDDLILVKDCWNVEPATITVNKTRVHIIGMALPTGMYPTLTAIGDTPIFTMPATGNNCEIAGLSLGGGNNNAGIELNNNMGSWIHDVWFGHVGAGDTPQDGIRNDAGLHNYNSLLVERCKFFGSPGYGRGTLTRYGCFFDASGYNGQNAQFVNNRFFNLSYAIRIVYGIDQLIEHNYIMCPSDDAIGRAIYVHMGEGSIIANNKACDDGVAAAMTNNPYYDALPARNAWLCNQEGIAWINPTDDLTPQ